MNQGSHSTSATGSATSGSAPQHLNDDIYNFTSYTPETPAQADRSNARMGGERQPSLQELGIFHQRPRNQGMAILAKRRETFEGWSENCPVTADDAASSGFVYLGYSDSCRCFFCNGGLRSWKEGDNAYVEHARWFPNCGHIRQLMGQPFVDIVMARRLRGETTINYDDVLRELESKGFALGTVIQEPPLREDIAVKSLVEEGYSEADVVNAAQEMRNDGITLSAEALFRKVAINDLAESDRSFIQSSSRDSKYGSEIDNMVEENRSLRHGLTCKVCLDREVKVVFLPCGHLVSCQECSTALRECPVCRGHIRACVMATFTSQNSSS